MPQLEPITIDELIEEFEFLGEWEDQCRYLIELGEELPDLPAHEKTEANRVHGCQSQVWFVPEISANNGSTRINLRAKSDARIVDGLIVVLLTLANGKTPREILDARFRDTFAELGLENHLVPQRRNGLYSMVERLRVIARGCLEAEGLTESPNPEIRSASSDLQVSDDDTDVKKKPLDVEAVRAQFPALQQTLPSGMPVIYLDTAASAQKPQCVIDKEREVYEQYYANAYRGVYRFGDRVSSEIEHAREKVRQFISAAHVEEIAFTSGTTMSINIVANGWGRKFLKAGDEILLNEMEHHANFVPWQWVAQATGAVLRFIPLTDDGQLDLDRLDEVLSEKTKIVAVTGMSNVLGTVPPITEIARRARAVGAKILVDGAQNVPHMPVNVVGEDIDFLAFSGHKLYGPSGIGVLYGRRELLEEMDPFLCGGHMIDRVYKDRSEWAALPAKFEAGTLPIAQAIALGRAVEFVEELSLCAIHTHEQNVLRYATERLGEIPGLKIYGPAPGHKGAICSFTVENAAAQDLAQLLDLKGVCVRHGHH
ncbi:MAG: SufS family cysteine desulfurase, partial [Maioricimonas sp. JB049]